MNRHLYRIVRLNEASRRRQMNDNSYPRPWFDGADTVIHRTAVPRNLSRSTNGYKEGLQSAVKRAQRVISKRSVSR